jgi:hypothetical protein
MYYDSYTTSFMYLNGVWSAPVPQFGLLVIGTGKHPSTLVGINLTCSLGQLIPL